MCVSTCVVCWQELILGKVKEDELVRVKISQSSALRPKRGHTDMNERLDLKESGALAGPNNNVADTKSEKNGIIHSNGTSVEAKSASNELKEVTNDSNGSLKEEESITTGSLSEISKFESKPDFCHTSPPPPPILSTLTSNCISIATVFSSKSRLELPAWRTSGGVCLRLREPQPLLDPDPGGPISAAGQTDRGDDPLLQRQQPRKHDGCHCYCCMRVMSSHNVFIEQSFEKVKKKMHNHTQIHTNITIKETK